MGISFHYTTLFRTLDTLHIADDFESVANTNKLNSNTYIIIKYKLFWSLWAIAALFHMANARIFADGLHYVLLSFAAVFLVQRPLSLIRMLFFLSLQLYESAKMMPYVSNHWIFTTLVNLTILQALAYQVIKNKSFRISRADFFKTFAPLVRIELIILYFYVVLHKLNTGFFNFDFSCATDLFVAQNSYSLVPVNQNMLQLSAYGTVMIEALIPVLLCFRKTRNWGLLLGLIFHFTIAYNPINGFYDFSSMLFAVYILFTDTKFISKIQSLFDGFHRLKERAKIHFYNFSYIRLGIAIVLFVCAVAVMHLLAKSFTDFFRHVGWTTYGLGLIFIFMTAMFSRKLTVDQTPGFFSVRHFSLLLFPAIVFINGMCPYLGLKTESSFAMFSNLRTEGGVTNHLFIPVDTQIFGYQKDVVEFIRSSDPNLQKLADNNQLLVYHKFKDYFSNKKPAMVEYVRNGKRYYYTAGNTALYKELTQENPLLHKLLDFRHFSKDGYQPCAH